MAYVSMAAWREIDGCYLLPWPSVVAYPMTVDAVMPPEKTFVNINRNVLICIFSFFLLIPPLINFVGGVRYDEMYTNSAGNTAWEIIELFTLVNCIVIALYLNITPRLMFFCLLPFAGMFIWIFLSITWSDYPWLTVRRGSRLVIEVVSFVILALSFSTSEGVLRILFRVFFGITLLDIVSIAVPSISQTDIGFAGVHGHKNLAGQFFYLALPVFFIGFLNRTVSRFRGVALFAFVSAAGMLLISQSKTAIVAALIATVFSVVTRVAISTRYRIPLLLICLFVALLLMLFTFNIGVTEAINYLFGDPTLTGRDVIWRYTLHAFNGNPLIGVGYGALWEVGRQLEIILADQGITFGVNEAHNGYIDILAQVGMIGLCFLVVFLLVTFIRVYKYSTFGESRKAVGFNDYAAYIFWGGLFYNVTETFFFTSSALWFFLVFVTTVAAAQLPPK
jgi:exopolysaccharide production protein ExoQ